MTLEIDDGDPPSMNDFEELADEIDEALNSGDEALAWELLTHYLDILEEYADAQYDQ